MHFASICLTSIRQGCRSLLASGLELRFSCFMKITKHNMRTALWVILSVLLLILLVQNSTNVTLRFLNLHAQMPLFAVILLSSLFGAGICWLARRRR